MAVFSNIACCVSLSENPDDLAQYVRDIVRQNEARLILIHVAPDSEALMRRQSEYVISSQVEGIRQQNKAAFEEYRQKYFADIEAAVVYAEGNTEAQLLKVVDKYCADLIIIGSMSTKGILGGLFGNSQASIIGRTRVPVLVVPNDLSLECTPDF
jgi:nucleotide-binding universal stress UspA family protein